LQYRVLRAFKKAGIDGERAHWAVVHGLRHTFATELAYSEVSVRLDESAWTPINVDLATLCDCSWCGESASRGAESPLRNLKQLPGRYGSG
jgi:hypothetical protein